MGRSTKPLTLVVHPTLVDSPEFVAMREQGHRIISMADCRMPGTEEVWIDGPVRDELLTSADMILGVNAWSFDRRQLYLLDRVIKIGRDRKYSRDESAAKPKKTKKPKPEGS